jgi:hypothetical protein
MIQQLVIHRFRGIREGVLEDIGKVNLLIGPNNSGKTALLELLYLAGLCGRPCNLILPNIAQNEEEEGSRVAWEASTLVRHDFLGEEPMSRLRQRHGESAKQEGIWAAVTQEGLAVEIPALPKGHPLRVFQLAQKLGQRVGFTKKDTDRIVLFRLERQAAEPPRLMIPLLFDKHNVRLEETTWHYLWETSWIYKKGGGEEEGIDHFAVWAIQGELPSAERILFFDFHTASSFFNERFARQAYKELLGWRKKIAQSLGRIFPELKDCSVNILSLKGAYWTGYIEEENRKPLEIDHFGDGTRHAFKVLSTLIALAEQVDEEHPGLFLWEDPEMFMHPASLGRLLGEVMRLITDKPIQVFLSTQSLEVLSWVISYLDKNPAIPAEQWRTFRLELKKGVLNVQPFIGRAIGGWLEFFGDPRMIGEDELASPLAWILYRREEKHEDGS